MSKLIYIDTETTGIDKLACGIVQIAGLIVVSGEVKETFDIHMQPFEKDVIELGALEVNGHTRESLFAPERLSPYTAKDQLDAILGKYVDKFNSKDKYAMVGYNVDFDAQFLRSWYTKHGDKYYGSWFWNPPIDVMSIAMWALLKERAALPNFKLGTVAKHLGLNPDGELHDALTDIKLTRSILQKIGETHGSR